MLTADIKPFNIYGGQRHELARRVIMSILVLVQTPTQLID